MELIKHVSLVKTVMFKDHSNSEWTMKNLFFFTIQWWWNGESNVFFLVFCFWCSFLKCFFYIFQFSWLCYFEKLQHNNENNCLYMSGSWCFELFDSRQLQLHTLFKNKGVSIGNFWRQTYWIFFNALKVLLQLLQLPQYVFWMRNGLCR